jgi:hypothetical protein
MNVKEGENLVNECGMEGCDRRRSLDVTPDRQHTIVRGVAVAAVYSTCSPPASRHGNVGSSGGVTTDEWHYAVVTVRSLCGYARVACRLTPSVMLAADRASGIAVAAAVVVVVVVVVAIVVAPVVPPTSVVVPSSALAVRTSVRAYAAVGRIARPSVGS